MSAVMMMMMLSEHIANTDSQLSFSFLNLETLSDRIVVDELLYVVQSFVFDVVPEGKSEKGSRWW